MMTDQFEDLNTLRECLKHVVSLTREAGLIVKQGYYDRDLLVEDKGSPGDLVTEYDRRTENFLIESIRKTYPNHKFIGEETTAKTKAKNILTDDPTWIIDPIDGTTNFVHRIPLICISVALVCKKRTVLAVCYNPVLDQLYEAVEGGGAFRNGERMKVSGLTEMKSAVVGIEVSIGGISRFRDHVMTRTNAIVDKVAGVRALGSAVLSLCYVATGQLDAYQIEFLWPWDVAAGALLIKEAGGVIKDVLGGDVDLMKPNVIAAASEELYQHVARIHRECIGKRIKIVEDQD